MDEIERIERRLKLHDRARPHVRGARRAACTRRRSALQPPSLPFRERLPTSNTRLVCAFSIAARAASSRRNMATRSSSADLRSSMSSDKASRISNSSPIQHRVNCASDAASTRRADRSWRSSTGLRGEHPRMVFDVVTGPVLTLYRDLTERKIELVITRTRRIRRPRATWWSRIYSMTTSSRWRRRKTRGHGGGRIDLAELVNEPWTLPSRDTGIGAFAIEAFRARGLEPPRKPPSSLTRCICATSSWRPVAFSRCCRATH